MNRFVACGGREADLPAGDIRTRTTNFFCFCFPVDGNQNPSLRMANWAKREETVGKEGPLKGGGRGRVCEIGRAHV